MNEKIGNVIQERFMNENIGNVIQERVFYDLKACLNR